jgi:hypothetical protein
MAEGERHAAPNDRYEPHALRVLAARTCRTGARGVAPTREAGAAVSSSSAPVPIQLLRCRATIVRPEHAVALLRLLGAGVAGDLVDLPRSQLRVLPGATHMTLVERASWLVSMITQFLATPMPAAQ